MSGLVMIDFDKLAALATQCGFTNFAPLSVHTLEFNQDVRNMCNPQACRNYNKSWSCPPACASLEELSNYAKTFSHGIIVQTVGDIEDSYDWDGIMAVSLQQKKNFALMRGELKKEYDSVFAMGSGACQVCDSCTYPDTPCRFPEKMEVSMEACGLFVSKVCKDNGIAYNYGEGKMAFTSCFLFQTLSNQSSQSGIGRTSSK